MKAAFYETTGSPDVIRYGDRPTPDPAAGQVRVKVMAASVNPIDLYARSGMIPVPSLPNIPGRDFAGVVEAVGPGAGRYKVGDRVWGVMQGSGSRPGSFAEFCVTDEQYAYPIPAGVTDADAAAAGLVGITAHSGLFQFAGLKPGETVFVNGGTGGVGSMVVQMAKAIGATVVTTVGSDAKAEQAKGFGADVVVNYKTGGVAAAVKDATGGKGIQVWYETQPPTDFDATFGLMAPRGRVIVMAGRKARPVFPNGDFYVKGLSMFGFAMFNNTAAELETSATYLSHWLAGRQVKVPVGKTFPLSQAAAAHKLQDENTLGKAGTLSGKIVVLPG